MKLSFIKLDINIMNDTKIKIIRKMPDGDRIIVLWVGILCLGMQSGKAGVLEIGDGIPFTPDTLSAELDIPIATVKLGLQTFAKLRMIEEFANNSIYISNFEKHQELDKIEIGREKLRLRVAKSREKKKNQLTFNGNDDVTVTGVTCNAIDIEQDKDKDKDIDLKVFLNSWNEFANNNINVSTIKRITPKRIKKIKTRCNNNTSFKDDFIECLTMANTSDFLKGNIPSDKNSWVFNFDWLISDDDNYNKILEGKYNKNSQQEKPSAESLVSL